ncbi:hypothetical protein H5410_006461 [Solanum commersonii]|uniref:Uncharacterized protein n=1 Tax=Solanum commersonii TaxID=4109 RepID=A0A9J6AAC7_SOLCO|nr:hypothetical protein H5410_006461 [Solanum commersonii]
MDFVVAFPLTRTHIDVVLLSPERSITNIIKGFEIPIALPWHLVGDVYIRLMRSMDNFIGSWPLLAKSSDKDV